MSLSTENFTVTRKHLWIEVVTKGISCQELILNNTPIDRGINFVTTFSDSSQFSYID